MSDKDCPDVMAKKSVDFLNTDEGKKVLKNLAQRANKEIKQVDRRTLNTPFKWARW